jgi:hypothetical protein
MRHSARSLGILRLGLATVVLLVLPLIAGAGPAPSPVPVTFESNINLTAQGDDLLQTQREPSIAVDPHDSRYLVEGNIDRKPGYAIDTYSFSSDGGRTWTPGGALPLLAVGDVSTDPVLTADTDGNFYYSYLDIDQNFTRPAVVVARSTDGGRSFPFHSVVRQGATNSTTFDDPDKAAIAADTWPKSAYQGSLYDVWSNLACTPTTCDIRIMVSRSTDRGATWSNAVTISAPRNADTNDAQSPFPVVAPNGTIYVFWMDYLFHTGPLNILFAKSRDGGSTWSAPAAVASGLPSPGLILIRNGDQNYGTKSFIGILANSDPTAAISADGTIFVAWTDVTAGTCHDIGDFYVPCTNTDVRMSVSGDGGRTWSAPRKVSDDTGATDQFFPWMAAHPNGLVSLSWADKRLDPANVNYDVFYTNTWNGSTFLPNVRVTTATSLSGNQQTPIQDYFGLAASADGVFPVWADDRAGQVDIYVAAGRFSP